MATTRARWLSAGTYSPITGQWLKCRMTMIWHDLRFALRALGKSPGFTAVAVVTLALGIGANLALFSLLNEQLLRPREVRKPDELWAILPSDGSGEPKSFNLSRPYYEAIRRDNRVFSSVIGYCSAGPNLRTPDGWEHVKSVLVSGDFFSFLGVQPILGRGFLPEEDDKLGTHSVAVISYRFWQEHFEGNPEVVGKTVTLGDQIVEIVGVAPRGFKGISLYESDLWLPASMERLLGAYPSFNLLGRLKEGVSPTRAAATLAPVVQNLTKMLLAGGDQFYTNNISQFSRVALLREGYGSLPAKWRALSRKEGFKRAGLVGVATVLLLIIAATNVANLLLARALRRRKEMATRLALGATRWTLIRQVMLEGLLLSGFGAAAAMLVLLWLSNVPATIMPGAVYANANITLHPDIRVAAFALAGALLVGAGFSIIPALHASRFDPFAALKHADGSAGFGKHRWSLGKVLMAAQVAGALILLSGTGLCLGAIQRQLRIDVGFRTDPIVVAEVDLERVGFTGETAQPVIAELRRRISLLPGVEAVGVMDMPPLAGGGGHIIYHHLDGYVPPNGESIELGHAAVSQDCFRALGISLVEGRDITEDDLTRHRPVALVNESLARKYWKNQTVLGKHIQWLRKNYDVVGIVRDSRLNSLAELPEPTVFFSTSPREAQNPYFIIRAKSDPKSLLKPVMAELTRVHPRLRESTVATLRQIMRHTLGAQRETMNLLGWLAALALALAALGVYGMMSYLVAQRTREIGIRMALGAERADVAALILRSGFGVALAGVAVGLPAAIGGASLLRHAVYGVSAFDWPAFSISALSVFLAILFASWPPARRASRADPMAALRAE